MTSKSYGLISHPLFPQLFHPSAHLYFPLFEAENAVEGPKPGPSTSFQGVFDVEGPLAGPSMSLWGVFAFRATAATAKPTKKATNNHLLVAFFIIRCGT